MPGENEVQFSLVVERLGVGDYLVSLDVTHPGVEYFDRVENCLSFSVARPPRDGAIRVLEQAWGYGAVQLSLRGAQVRRCQNEK